MRNSSNCAEQTSGSPYGGKEGRFELLDRPAGGAIAPGGHLKIGFFVSQGLQMIDKPFVERMARYNMWQNANVYGCADQLGDEDRKRERGAFFGSIHATLNHLLWADRIWMHRFAGVEKPAVGIPGSVALHAHWEELKRERTAFDQVILDWAENLDSDWLQGDLTWYSGSTGREATRPKWVLITHMFNHQTHHRGQVHCLLTQYGIKPSATDLPFLPA